jgi:hypothetical protein
VPVLGNLLASVFQVWLSVGVSLFFLKRTRGQQAEIGEIFQGGPFFLRVFLAGLLLFLILAGIVIVCVAPLLLVGFAISQEAALILGIVGGAIGVVAAICVMLALSQYQLLIIDQDVGVLDSLKMSRNLMVGNKLTLFSIGLLCSLITLVAVIPCGLGLIVVIPFTAFLQPVVYLAITGQPMADPSQIGP